MKRGTGTASDEQDERYPLDAGNLPLRRMRRISLKMFGKG